ncbi:tryptophan--tRNA ligase, partial [Candidatus Parcubacteria bacterium]|nr:tryptophan--tRNA ligase [Candidatus Parcubacteria bacterium]
RLFDITFKLPEPFIPEEVATIPGIDGRKMSKSYGNTIPFFAPREELRKLVLSIQTDSKGITEPKNPDTCTVFALHRLFSEEQLKDLEARYRKGGIGYHESKEILLKNMEAFIAPFRAKREKIMKDISVVETVLRNGGMKARNRAAQKMKAVRERVGLA